MNLERTKYMRELRRKIAESFDLDELQTLTFDLAVDWDELPGEKKSTKSQSLVKHLAQRGRLEDLLIILLEERPGLAWPKIPDTEQQRLDEQYLNPNIIKLDRELFNKIREILPSDGSIYYVRGHDYGGAFPRDMHDDLAEFIIHLERPEFEFFDPELEAMRLQLAKHIQDFWLLIGQESFPLHDRDWNRIPRLHDMETISALRHRSNDDTHFERIFKEYEENLKRVRNELNSLANEICNTYDDFIRLGRRKLAA